ncbi:MAG TPA: host-nuclease inhibitor Gam family protein [Syntrophales bacterium]|nr:host-nuclease inhibitor Gam family protein [Syntrophales bacterium]
MATLGDIERLTKEYAEWRRDLSEAVLVAEHEIAAIKRRHVVAIKRKVEAVAERQAQLKAVIEANPELFKKPRTMIIDGVKIGFMKEKGKISWNDAGQVIKLIKKHFPDQADLLIKTTEKLVKGALQQLPAADLKRIAVTVGADGDAVVIKSTDSEIDKLVEALLKDDTKDDADEEAA